MIQVPVSTLYVEKFKGFNHRTLEYIQNTREYTYNVLEGAVRSSKTVANVYAAAMAIEESRDRLHIAMGFSSKAAVRNIFESDGLGLMYMPFWQGRLFTKSTAPGVYSLVLMPPEGSDMPIKEILPIDGGEADSESSFRGFSVGICIVTEANLLHPNSIIALNERTYAANIRRFFIDFNPSSPANFLYSFIGRKWLGLPELPLKTGTALPVGYVKKLASGKEIKVLQYLHMTFNDNMSLSPSRIEEILATSDPDSPEYKRNVLGLRASGAGKIYNLRSQNYLQGQIERANYLRYVIVADPGTSASETAFILAALTNTKVPELHILNEYAHENNMENLMSQKADVDYAYDFFSFIKECEGVMGIPPYKVIVDAAAVSFIREYNRNARVNGIIYSLCPCVKGKIDERIKQGKTLQYTGRLKYHKTAAQKTISEFEDAEYDEKKSLNGTYERLDQPERGKQIGLIDCTEYAIEAFSYILFRSTVGTKIVDFSPYRAKTNSIKTGGVIPKK
jgi:hypothetical protein